MSMWTHEPLGTVTTLFLAVEQLSQGGGADDFTTLASGTWATLLSTAAEHAVALHLYRATNILSASSERAVESLLTRNDPLDRPH